MVENTVAKGEIACSRAISPISTRKNQGLFGKGLSLKSCCLVDGLHGICFYFKFGRTEVIYDNLNPDFVKKFIINYYFEECQKLKFEV